MILSGNQYCQIDIIRYWWFGNRWWPIDLTCWPRWLTFWLTSDPEIVDPILTIVDVDCCCSICCCCCCWYWPHCWFRCWSIWWLLLVTCWPIVMPFGDIATRCYWLTLTWLIDCVIVIHHCWYCWYSIGIDWPADDTFIHCWWSARYSLTLGIIRPIQSVLLLLLLYC